MNRLYLVIFLVTGTVFSLSAQDFNDCESAFNIQNPIDFCTENGFFDLNDATPSSYGPAGCFDTDGNDIWLRFTALRRDVTVIVTGNTSVNPKGTLEEPQVALYEGVCGGTIQQRKCAVSPPGGGIAELFQGALEIGRTYYIRVQSGTVNLGTFNVCIRNYNSTQQPESDCIDGAFICNKDGFIVRQVEGGGSNTTEIQNTPCGLGSETSSTWFKFICGESGELEFTLFPLNESDDLDFVLYQLPNGINDCSGKNVLRCMASGAGPVPESPCYGPTGLRGGETDVNEQPNCPGNQNNFLRPADLTEGNAYALVVNNFTSTGNGFEIEWGGDAEFQGPDPIVEVNTDDPQGCYQDGVEFTGIDAGMNDAIVDWQWFFGETATPRTFNGPGPINVDYSKAGTKNVVLQVETAKGCFSTVEVPVELICCDEILSIELSGNTEIDLGESTFLTSEVQLKGDTLDYQWTPPEDINCPDCPDTEVFPRDGEVTYSLFVEDEFGCSVRDSITIEVTIDYQVYAPTAFTPNQDGINDRYTLFANIGAETIQSLVIFNRWGDRVFEGNNLPPNQLEFGWDGTFRGQKLNPGVYAFTAEVRFFDGFVKAVQGEIEILK